MQNSINRVTFRKSAIAVAVLTSTCMTVSNADVLEEVIVTAQKREQSLQDVGIAVAAFSAEQINALGFTDSTDIVAMAPGISMASSSGGHLRQFTIRGVSQNDFFDGVEGPIAVYVDEGYIGVQQGATFGLFDMERVESLKGPQGTLFGRNATGGLVHYITKKPSFDGTEGYLDINAGSYDTFGVEFALGGPLTEKLAARVAFTYRENGDYVDNDFPLGLNNLASPPVLLEGGGQDLGAEDNWGGRIHLLFKPSDNVDILLSGYASEYTFDSGPYESQALVPIKNADGQTINAIVARPDETREAIGPNGEAVDIIFPDLDFDGVRPTPGGDLFGFRDPDLGDFRTSHEYAFNDFDTHESYGVTLNISWALESFTLTSISDFKTFNKFQAADVGSAPSTLSVFMTQSEADTFAQEFRLSGDWGEQRWTAGTYYLNMDNKTQNGLSRLPYSFLNAGIFPNIPAVGGDDATDAKLKTESYSVFGQIDYKLSEDLSLTFGARLIKEEKKFHYTLMSYNNDNDLTLDLNTPFTSLRGAGSIPADAQPGEVFSDPYIGNPDETLWAAKIQLDWRPSDNVLIYAGINRGVKAGSFNNQLPLGDRILNDEQISYDEEILVSYETGFKTTILDDTTRFNGSLFFYDYSDYQAFKFNGAGGTVENKDATILGGELELVSNPISGLDVFFSVSIFDAEVEDVEIATGVFRDVDPTFSPELQVAGLIRYGWPAFGGELAVQLDAQYTDESYGNIKNFDAHIIPSYTVANSNISWSSDDGRWQGIFSIKNLFDKSYITSRFDLEDLCGCGEVLFGKPRWYDLSVRYNFQ